MSSSGPGPSKAGYWVGAAVVVVGVVGAILWGVLGFLSFGEAVDGFQRVPANGRSEVTFTRTGGYVIYYEGPGADVGDIPAGEASLTPDGSDEPVSLETYASSLSYSYGDHAGQAVLTFDIEQPGTYVLDSTSDGDGDLAVGRSIGGKLVSTVVGAFALGGLGVVVGAIVLIVTFVRRRNARPRAAPWYPPPPGAGPPPPPPPGGPSWPPPPGPPPPSGPPPPPGVPTDFTGGPG